MVSCYLLRQIIRDCHSSLSVMQQKEGIVKKIVITNQNWTTPKAVIANGFVFLSGTTSKNPDGSYQAAGDIAAQTKVIIDRIAADLESVGSSLSDVVKVVAYLDDIDNWSLFNEVYLENFQNDRPARTTIQAGGFEPGACLEMDVIAVLASE